MKKISNELSAALEGEALTLCLCWRLKRRDGVVIGLTEHDRALSVDGIVYEPGAAIEAGAFSQSAGMKPGRAAAAGALSADSISETDLDAGAWDRAHVDIYRVDWRHPEWGAIPMWTGFLSEIVRGPTGVFEAELVSLKAELERPVGRVLQKRCNAVLGDARCGVSDIAGRTCDQLLSTCRDRFANTDNFRGFPHMPGTDFVLAGPTTGNNEGGRR